MFSFKKVKTGPSATSPNESELSRTMHRSRVNPTPYPIRHNARSRAKEHDGSGPFSGGLYGFRLEMVYNDSRPSVDADQCDMNQTGESTEPDRHRSILHFSYGINFLRTIRSVPPKATTRPIVAGSGMASRTTSFRFPS